MWHYAKWYQCTISRIEKINKLNNKQIYELNECLNFFQKEFENLDSRTKGILISEITRITNTFISDYDIFSTFSLSYYLRIFLIFLGIKGWLPVPLW